MKYWRGYLVALIFAACCWALRAFSAAHTELVDMAYPYITRIVMDYLASWSAGVEGCLWQILLLFGIAALLGSVILMIVLRWNPVQWFGWVLAVVSVVCLLHTGIYGLNEYAGPIHEDVRLELKEYSVGSLERAANYYRDMANMYAHKVDRNTDGTVKTAEFEALAGQAAAGFEHLGYERTYPVFTGSTQPVKQLGWSGLYKGKTGVTVALTGESAVNPDVPGVGIPFAICHEMAHRMCIYGETDADFSAFLACVFNPSEQYRYSAYLMAYRCCYNALSGINTAAGREALSRVVGDTDDLVLEDMADYNAFAGEGATEANEELCKLLVSWHIQEYAQYEEPTDDEAVFDPLDESDPRFDEIFGRGEYAAEDEE